MKKASRLIKRYIALLLVLLFSIESFAAVVGDNDGAAFITKAEFDSMKNDFQSQLDRYNSSLDNKIDGAIANYLSGVTTAKKTDIKPGVEKYDEIRWMHGPYNFLTTRHYTNFQKNGSVDGYSDNTGWQIIEMDNRRQSAADMSLWFFDNMSARTGELVVAGRLNWVGPHDNRWGYGTFPAQRLDSNYNKSKRAPSLYVQATIGDDGCWTLKTNEKVIVGELGVKDEIHAFPHWPEPDTSGSNTAESLGDNRRFTLSSALDDSTAALSFTNGAKGQDDFIEYTIGDIYTSTNGTDRLGAFTLHSKVRLKDNPALFLTSHTEVLYKKYADGAAADNWRTGLSLNVAPEDPSSIGNKSYYPTVDSARYHQHLWETQQQYEKDNVNLYYAFFGSDINTNVNIAPHVKHLADYDYLDLSKSENSITLEAEPSGLGLSAVHPHLGRTSYGSSVPKRLHAVEFGAGSTIDNVNLTIPLFYRATWSEIKTDAFKNRFDKQPLAKGAGLPILVDAENAGTVTLSFNYEEDSNTDSSVVRCTPDQKIKTYFKTKNFLDKDGKYWSGWTNLNASGSGVNLNGTEWTGGEVKITIDVKKGDSIWMRIDPLTEDGVYCTMSNYKCNLTVE